MVNKEEKSDQFLRYLEVEVTRLKTASDAAYASYISESTKLNVAKEILAEYKSIKAKEHAS